MPDTHSTTPAPAAVPVPAPVVVSPLIRTRIGFAVASVYGVTEFGWLAGEPVGVHHVLDPAAARRWPCPTPHQAPTGIYTAGCCGPCPLLGPQVPHLDDGMPAAHVETLAATWTRGGFPARLRIELALVHLSVLTP